MRIKNTINRLLAVTGIVSALLLTSCGSHEPRAGEESAAATPAAPKQIIPAGEDGNRYFVDENNKRLFGDAKFHRTYEFKNGYCIVSKMVGDKELRGVIDSNGKEVVACIMDAYLDDVHEGMVKFSKDGRDGYIDLTGKVVIPAEYTNTKGFSGGMVKMEKDYKAWGILDKTGKVIVPFEYQTIGVWGNDLAPVEKRGKWGFINRRGELQFPAVYDFAWGFEQGVCLVGKGKKYALINTKNEQLTDFIFDGYMPVVDVFKNEFSSTGRSETNKRLVIEEGVMIVSKDGLWGMMNTKGEEVLPYEYTSVDVPESSGKVEVTKDDKRGYFDLKTKTVSWN